MKKEKQPDKNDKKALNEVHELNDEDLDQVSGGVGGNSSGIQLSPTTRKTTEALAAAYLAYKNKS